MSEVNLELDRLAYDPDTGAFVWRRSTSNRKPAGAVAGSLRRNGYVHIKLGGKSYPAHRLAWRIVHGLWPAHQLDHINGVRSDNRIVNLREATQAENLQNRSRLANNTSGYPGVTYHVRKRAWQAQIDAGGKRFYLGRFADPAAAHAAYVEAKQRLHTFHPDVPSR